MLSYKYHICGFNGFGQISECVTKIECIVAKEEHLNHTSDIYDKTNSNNSSETFNKLLSSKNSDHVHTTFTDSSQSSEIKAKDSIDHEQLGSKQTDPQTESVVTDKELNTCTSNFPCSRSICSPQLINLQPVFLNWSQIWTKSSSDCGYSCYGYNSVNIMTNLMNKFGQIPQPVIQVQDHNILAKNGSDSIIIHENSSVAMVTNNVDDVTVLDATKDKIYGLKDNQLYEGEITGDNTDIKIQYCLLSNIPVTMVSCGFDHTIMLTKYGDVFSLGLGSRGQLGHGEVTVDYQTQPRKIETFDGIRVVSIVTGGWHSCAITDTADVYVWGWNESGQLGIPTNSRIQDQNVSHETSVHSQSPVYSKLECSSNVSDKYDRDETSLLNLPNDCHKFENLKEKLDCVTDKKLKENFDCVTDEKLKENLDFVTDEKLKEKLDCVIDEESSIKNSIDTKLYQSIDNVKVQSEPYGLEVPDNYRVKMAACGSRHTCVLMECGTVFTAGWNGYGQLCHGDKISRDVFEMVKYFKHNSYSIDSVQAAGWNTLVVSVTNT